MKRVALPAVVVVLLAGSCSKATETGSRAQPSAASESPRAEAGAPLFAGEAWKQEPQHALIDLVRAIAPDWQVSTEAVELESSSHLVVRGLRIANADASTVMLFESLEVRGTERAVEIAGRLRGAGSLEARLRSEPTQIAVEVAIEGIGFGHEHPWRLSTGDVPLRGMLDGRASIRLPERSWAKASGTIELACRDCGTAETKIELPAPRGRAGASAFAASGLTLPALRLGDVAVRLELVDGAGSLALETSGDPDLALSMKGELRASDPFGQSHVNLCAKLSLSEEARRASPTLEGLNMVLARGAAGAGAAMRMTGRLDSPRVRPVQGCD